VTASRLASVTPQLLCIDLLRLSHSLSAVSPTSSHWLHLSTHLITLLRLSFELLTLSPPFRRLSQAVFASPPTCRKCLHFFRLSPSLSHEHPTNFAFSDTFSLHVCFTFGKKNLLHITSVHVTMTSVSFKKRKKKKRCHVSNVKIEFEFYVQISFSFFVFYIYEFGSIPCTKTAKYITFGVFIILMNFSSEIVIIRLILFFL